jgi:hypothetical protein
MRLVMPLTLKVAILNGAPNLRDYLFARQPGAQPAKKRNPAMKSSWWRRRPILCTARLGTVMPLTVDIIDQRFYGDDRNHDNDQQQNQRQKNRVCNECCLEQVNSLPLWLTDHPHHTA